MHADPAMLSVILPTHDRAALVAGAVRAALAGTYADLEVVVVTGRDAGSKSADSTSSSADDELADLAAGDARVRVVTSDATGVWPARAAGAAAARGAYLTFAHPSDTWHAGRLERQVAFLASNPDVDVVAGGIVLTGVDGAPARTLVPPADDASLGKALQFYNPLHLSTAVVRRSAFEAAGGFAPALAIAGDYDLWLRVAERGRLASLGEPVVSSPVRSDAADPARVERLAAEMLAARAAARDRRAGRPDPLAGARSVTPDLLAAMGISPADLRRSEFAALLARAELLAEAGLGDDALQWLDRASALTNTATDSRSTLASLHRGYVKVFNRQWRSLKTWTAAAVARAEVSADAGAGTGAPEAGPEGLVGRVRRSLARHGRLLKRRPRPAPPAVDVGPKAGIDTVTAG